MIYNREEALNLLGCACNNLNYLRDRTYDINQNDFDDLFHKLIFGVLQNLAIEKDIQEVDGFTVATYLKKFPVQFEKFNLKNGVEQIQEMKTKANNSSFDYSYKMVKKFSLLRRFKSVGMDISEIYNPDSLNVKQVENQIKILEVATIEQIKQHFKQKLIEIDLEFQTKGDSYYFRAGDGVEDLLRRCKEKQHWGITFQSAFFNSIFGGIKPSTLLIRSSDSGGGKSRQAIGDMCNIACPKRFHPKKRVWIRNNNPKDVVFISTELTEDELHLAMLATIAGVPEESIKYGKTNGEEDKRLAEAVLVLKESKIHCEYTSNYSLSELENIIEKNIIRNGARYIFFDYVQLTSNLSAELNNLFGYVLREDQMLQQTTCCLKNLANKYKVAILTSTQLNRNYKNDSIPDATWLRGGMAVLDKADYGIISMRVTEADLIRLQPILQERFGGVEPTHCHHIIKNRGGKWVQVTVWVCMDLDTINVYELDSDDGVGFVTYFNGTPVRDIMPIEL